MAMALRAMMDAALQPTTKARYDYAKRKFYKYLRFGLKMSVEDLRRYTGPGGPKENVPHRKSVSRAYG